MTTHANEEQPLSGIRVLDLTHYWAGPKCTKIMADLGADVIKIEGPRRSDPARGITAALGMERYPDGERGERPHNRSGYFNITNRSKRGIALDLASSEGKRVFKELAQSADVVVDNFRSGVMERLGLGYEVLSENHPELVMMSMSGFGSTGPESSYVAFADTLEALAGITGLTGYPDSGPRPSFRAFSDPLNGVLGVFAVLAALRNREVTGQGQLVEMAQLEGLMGLLLPAVVEWQAGFQVGPRGNSRPDRVPRGLYPCADDRWLAVDVGDEHWADLCRVMERPDLGADAELAEASGRLRRRDEVDKAIVDWTDGADAHALSERLMGAGVPASIVADVADLAVNDQLQARGVFMTIDHAEVGPYRYFVGTHARFPRLDLHPPRPAPLYGEHTFEVLSEIVGLSDEELAKLEADEVISRDYIGDPLQ